MELPNSLMMFSVWEHFFYNTGKKYKNELIQTLNLQRKDICLPLSLIKKEILTRATLLMQPKDFWVLAGSSSFLSDSNSNTVSFQHHWNAPLGTDVPWLTRGAQKVSLVRVWWPHVIVNVIYADFYFIHRETEDLRRVAVWWPCVCPRSRARKGFGSRAFPSPQPSSSSRPRSVRRDCGRCQHHL